MYRKDDPSPPKTMKFRYIHKIGMVIASHKGDLTFDMIIKMINQAVEEATKHQCRKIIFDIRQAIIEQSFEIDYTLYRKLLEITPLTSKHSIALLVNVGPRLPLERIMLWQDVANNWGTSIFRVFYTLPEAKHWLSSIKTD